MGAADGSADIATNIERVRQRLEKACLRVGRESRDVTLIAVTKTQPPERIAQAHAAGIRHFGENYVQEALSKVGQPPCDGPDVTWHFIGHLQSNKVRDVLGRFALIQSVDSLGLAREMARRAVQKGIVAPILLEVKLDSTPAKFGFAPDRVLDDAAEIAQMDGITLRGLMGMAPFSQEPEQARPAFQQMRALFSHLPPEARQVLSMGMTNDFEIAVEEGATHVRIGTAIFGQR